MALRLGRLTGLSSVPSVADSALKKNIVLKTAECSMRRERWSLKVRCPACETTVNHRRKKKTATVTDLESYISIVNGEFRMGNRIKCLLDRILFIFLDRDGVSLNLKDGAPWMSIRSIRRGPTVKAGLGGRIFSFIICCA